MALTLPSSPTLNQPYTLGTKTWTWNGTTWKASIASSGGGASTTLGLTAPTSPTDGTMWYDTSDGTLYISNSGIWAEAVVAAAGASANPLPTGNTAQRPGSPTVGNMRINSETNYVEVYYNTNWINLTYIGLVTATSTNANVTYSGNYAIHTFLTSGTFTPTYVPVGGTVEYLVVAGGGSGGGSTGGGGGAGGYLTPQAGLAVAATAYTIVVGGGAPGVSQQSPGVDGTNSTAFGLTAVGGGGGGYSYSGGGGATGRAGGSGGGGESYTNGYSAGGSGTAGPPVQGYAGGTGGGGNSGGGGGASMVGYNGTSSTGGNGGDGIASAINGTTVYRGGGGGGAGAGSGGLGGGGSAYGSGPGSPATVNTGGGGGGGQNYSGGGGGAGGSGVVIIRYRYQ